MTKSTSLAGKSPRRDQDKETFWRRTLKEQAASGQGIRAFCAARGLSEPAFYAWRRTLAQRDGARPAGASVEPATPAAPRFLPIRLAELDSPPTDTAPIEIVLPDGCRIRLRPPMDVDALRQIVGALRASGVAES